MNGELEVDQPLHLQREGQAAAPLTDRAEGSLSKRDGGKAAGGITGMDARRFDVFHQAADDHVALVVAERIDVHLNRIFQVLVDQHRMVGFHLNRLQHVAIELLFVEDHLHGATTQHIGRADHHRIAHAGRHIPGFRLTAGQAMPGLANLQLAQDRFELLAIFSTVDRLRRRAPDLGPCGATFLGVEPVQQGNRQFQWGLPPELDHHAVRLLDLDHIEDILEGEGLEIEAVAGVVVRRDGLRVAVHHHRCDACVLSGEGGMAAAVVEFDPLANPVGPAPKDHHLAPAAAIAHFAGWGQRCEASVAVQLLDRALVGRVVIRRGGCEFSRTGVNGLEHGSDSEAMAMTPHTQFIAIGLPGDLAIRKAELLEFEQLRSGQVAQLPTAQQLLLSVDDASQLGQEPGINAADPVNFSIGPTSQHGAADAENPLR